MKHTASRFTCSLRSLRIRSLAFAHLALLIPFVLPADTFGPYTYTVSDGQATITDFDSTCSGNLSITNELGGCPVISIGDDASRNRTALTDVTIPDSVTNIGSCAFAGCTNLTTILFTSNAPTIQDNSFDDTPAILYYLSETTGWSETVAGRPTKLIPLWWHVFDNGTQVSITDLDWSYTGHLPIPAVLNGCPVTILADNACFGCNSLTSVTIPDSVTNIGNCAFADCTSLISITIPDSVTSIGDYAFSYCTNLTSAVIPDSVIDIGIYAFSDCDALASVTIGNGITFINHGTFDHCRSLTSVTIPNGVTDIGWGAFSRCWELASVTIPNSVTNIYDYAFHECWSLKSVVIPGNVTNIGNYAFVDCKPLTAVLFTGNAPTIGTSPFDKTPVTIYYLPGTTGWGSSFAGHAAACWNPAFSPASPLCFDDSGAFVFAITARAEANIPVRIQASDSLASPNWITVDDIIIPAFSYYDSYFVDPDPTPRPSRFYRIVFPQ